MPITRRPDFGRVRQAIAAEMGAAMRDSLTIAERAVKLRYSGPTGPARLASRSGRLRAAASGRELRGGPPPAPIIGRLFPRPVLRYATVHEFGMVIHARRARYLTFPVGPYVSATRRGGPWVRVRSVRIPARPVWATAAQEIAPAVRARFERAVRTAITIAGPR